jgi:hypothetical protein
MDFDHVKARLVGLAAENGGNLTAALVEDDPELSANRELVSAAARELASDPTAITGEETDAREWFPYSFIILHS